MKMKVCMLECVCVFVWEYKRIKACSQPRVQTGPFLTIPSVYLIGWWGINSPAVLLYVYCVSVGLREDMSPKKSQIFLPVQHCQEPPRPLQLWPEKPPLLSPAVASAAVFTDSFFDSVSCVDLHFLLKCGHWCRPSAQLQSQRLYRLNSSNTMTPKIKVYACRYLETAFTVKNILF